MIREYLQAAMATAQFKEIEDRKPIFGEIPCCPGVWATGRTLEECRKALEEALEGWVLLGIRFGDELAEIDGIRLEIPETSPVRE